MHRIGVCLSGGAARGIAHLGVLQAFQEMGVNIHALSGVSSGAIAGAFFAAGYSPKEILKLVVELPLPKFLRPAFNKGILHTQALHSIFSQHLKDITFEDLPFKLVITALDLVEGNTVYFTQGSVVEALMASTAVPVLFKPYPLGNKLLVDGGLLNNMPIECLMGECDKVIGVHVNPTHHQAEIKSIRQVTERVFHLAVQANVQQRTGLCHLFVEPPQLRDYHIYAINKAQELFDIGYRYTHSLKTEIGNI